MYYIPTPTTELLARAREVKKKAESGAGVAALVNFRRDEVRVSGNRVMLFFPICFTAREKYPPAAIYELGLFASTLTLFFSFSRVDKRGGLFVSVQEEDSAASSRCVRVM